MSVFDTVKKIITGDAAHNAADTTNPVKIGGKSSSTAPSSVTDGNRVNAWFNPKGQLVVALGDLAGSTFGSSTASADGRSPGVALHVFDFLHTFNGTDWDRLRMDKDGTVPAATSAVYVQGGIYQTSVTSPDAGDVGRSRINVRRGNVEAGDQWNETLYNDTPANTDENILSITMDGARGLGFYISNSTGQAVTIRIYIYIVGASKVYEEIIANGATKVLGPAAGGTGADVRYEGVPALGFPVFALPRITYQCAGAASGALRVDLGRLT